MKKKNQNQKIFDSKCIYNHTFLKRLKNLNDQCYKKKKQYFVFTSLRKYSCRKIKESIFDEKNNKLLKETRTISVNEKVEKMDITWLLLKARANEFAYSKLTIHQQNLTEDDLLNSLSSSMQEISQCRGTFIGKTKLKLPFTRKLSSATFVYDGMGKFVTFGGNIAVSGSRWITSELQCFPLNGLVLSELLKKKNSQNNPMLIPWQKIVTQEGPKKRNLHSFTALTNKSIILYGGKGIEGNLSDMWEFKDNSYWTEIPQDSNSNYHPGARRLHQTAVWNRLQLDSESSSPILVIYGGINKKGNTLEDLWLFDYATKSWFQIPLTNQTKFIFGPENKSYPQLAVWRNSLLLCNWTSNKENYNILILGLDFGTGKRWHGRYTITKKNPSNLVESWFGIVIGSKWFFFNSPFRIISYCYVFDLLAKVWCTLKIDWDESFYPKKSSFRIHYIEALRSVVALSEDLDLFVFSAKEFHKSWTWENQHLAIWMRSLAKTGLWKRSCILSNFEWNHFFKYISDDIFSYILEYL